MKSSVVFDQDDTWLSKNDSKADKELNQGTRQPLLKLSAAQ
jgi:hypothetical protein